MDTKTTATRTDVSESRIAATRNAISVTPEALDEMEQLWGSVFFSADHKIPRSVIVTGAEPNEGATEVAIALALVGASSNHGHRVALVDFNLREPRVARVMGVPESPGVLDALKSGSAVSGSKLTLAHGQLTVVPAGSASAQATAPLDPGMVSKLIANLLENNDHVIIDAPAVNRQSTVQAMASMTDGVVLVARQAATRREAIGEAKKRIELAQGKLIGLVLNMRKFPVPGFLYRRM